MEVQYFTDEEVEENINDNTKEKKIGDYGINIIQPKNNNGYTIAYITKVLSKVKNDLFRREFEMMIYSIILEDELINFFKQKHLPERYDYNSLEYLELVKVKNIFDADEYVYYTFQLMCQHLKMFFVNPEKFYNDVSNF